MRKKSIFVFLSVLILGVFTTLGFFSVRKNEVYAQSTTASVWDGEYLSEVDAADFYVADGTSHILTASGFGFFAERVRTGISQYMDQDVVLDCDIDLAGNEWTPIGYDDNHMFKGRFNGNGHYIYNLKIHNSTSNYVGLFGTTVGTISNLNLVDVDIKASGKEAVGGIVGNLNTSTGANRNLSVTGKIEVDGVNYVGGAVGESVGSTLRNVSNILSDVEISTKAGGSASTAVGGVFGKYAVGNGTLEEIAFKGSIDVNATYAGGLLGQIDAFGNFRNSYNAGSVKNSGTYTAGLVANVAGVTGSLQMSYLYNAGKLDWKNSDDDSKYCSGLFGLFARSGTKTISNCFNIDTARSARNNSPIYANPNGSTVRVSNVWHNVDSYVADSTAVIGLATLAKTKSFYSNEKYFADATWDFETVWGISTGINNSYPYLLKTQNLGNPNNDTSFSTELEGDGSFENPYLIFTASDLGYVSANYDASEQGNANWSGKYFSLQNDIDLTGRTWQPIGASNDNAFSGVFDGNGHTIYGMTCSLQFQYSYHGLFGVTSNAVIKNLTVADVRFINGGTGSLESSTSAGVMGALVGYARANTYLANCVDNSNIYGLKTVGKAESDALTVAYGKNNLVDGEIKTLSVTGAKTAYDVELDGNGGVFYDKDGKIISGTYHLMVDAEGDLLSRATYDADGIETVNIPDRSWGMSLPQLSDKISEKDNHFDILVKKGSKLTSYSMLGGAHSTFALDATNFGALNSALILGLRANFEVQQAKSLQVVYNQYEVDNFKADNTASYVRSQVYQVEYDSILSIDYPHIFNTTPTKDGKVASADGSNLLRGKDFTIEGFYFEKDGDLFGTLVDGTAFANDENLKHSEIYVKWVGSSEVNYQFNVAFNKTDDKILGNLDLADAIESVTLSSYGGTENWTKQGLLGSEDANGKLIVSFDFDTTFSDLTTNGLSLKFNFKSGYDISGNIILRDLASGTDFNFGHMSYAKGSSVTSEAGVEQDYSAFAVDGQTFLNLVGDYTLDVFVQRKLFSTELNVSSDELYFALAPNIPNTKELSVFANGFDGAPEAMLATTKVVEQLFVGYDVINKSFVSSAETVGKEDDSNGHAFDIDMSAYTDVLLGYKFDDNGTEKTRYFKFVKETYLEKVGLNTVEYPAYVLYEMLYQNENWEKIDLIATLVLSDDETTFRKISYLTGAEFVLLGSVQDDASEIVVPDRNYDNFQNGGEYDVYKNANTKVLTKAFSDGDSIKKIQHDIKIDEIADGLTSQIGWSVAGDLYEEYSRITLVSKYTKVSFDLKFVDVDGNPIRTGILPTAYIDGNTNLGLPDDGKTQDVKINFTASDYYKLLETTLDGKISVVLTGRNIPNAKENVLIVAETVATQVSESDNGQGWLNNFNENNAEFFSVGSVSKNGKLSMYDNADKTAYDNYQFTLSFTNELRAGKYTIKFVCQPVNYSIDFGTKFIKYDQSENYSAMVALDKTILTDENLVQGLPTVVAKKNAQAIESGDDTILFSDEISMETALGDNNGYTFFDWYVESEKWSGFLKDFDANLGRSQDIEFVFSSIYDYVATGVTSAEIVGKRNYKVEINAVYIRKEIDITLSDRVSVTGDDSYTTAGSLGVVISFNRINYSYSVDTANDAEQDLFVSFGKGGTNGDSYYFNGFIILNSSNAVVDTIYSGDGVAFTGASVKSFFIDKLENDETMKNLTLYTLVPILTRKTANISFVSGTGNGIDGAYTDGKNGKVFDVDGNETANTIVTISDVGVGSSIYLNTTNPNFETMVDGTAKSVVIDELFAGRVGYTTPANAYWYWSNGASSGALNGSQLFVASSYFVGTTDDKTSIELVVYRNWTPNSYIIQFSRNQGVFGGDNVANESVSITVNYDQKVEGVLTFNDISKVGYALAGWTLAIDDKDTIVFDENGQSKAYEAIIDEFGNYISTNNLNVYALWTPKTYKVQLVTNGANTIAGNEAESTIDFEMAYGASFAEAFNAYGLMAGENAPTREGFVFNGVYASGTYTQTITSSTLFSETLPGCVLSDNEDVSLKIFIDWQFDSTHLALSLTQNLISKQYTSNDVMFYIAEFFENGFNADGYIVEIVDDQTISITVNDAVGAKVNVEITSAMVDVIGNSAFSAENVGLYNVTLVLTLEDLISEGVTLYTQTISLYAQISETTLSVGIESDNEDVWLVNVKRIMSKFVPSATMARIENCNTFDAFVKNVLSSLDSTVTSGVTNKQAYEFVMYKYFYMLTSTNYKTYKEMTYADFAEQRATIENDVKNVVSRMYFFDFYNHKNSAINDFSVYNNSIVFSSPTVENPRREVEIDRVEISATSINVDTTYYFRAYIRNADGQNSLGNFVLNYDENGDAYVNLGQVYILPELLEVENRAASKAAYYNANLASASSAWQGNRQELMLEGFEGYYKIDDTLYAKANLLTSNNGKEKEDVDYSFVSDKNYLYYTNVSIYERSVLNGEIVMTDVTNRYKLILGEDDIFSILNVDGVATIDISAKYLTYLNGFMNFGELPTTVSQNLLRITQVTYDLNDGLGVRRLSDSTNGYLQVRNYEDNGVIICQIENNNANEISAILSKFVLTVTVSTTEKSLSDYLALYKWSETETFNIDGTMENNTSFTIEKASLSEEAGMVTTYNLYAVYTDMVLVNYNLNFPSNYSTSSATTSLLKLGASTVEDLLMPNENGFKLASLTSTKTKVSYEKLFDSTDGTFKGINSSDRHAKVELEAKWMIEEMTYGQSLTEYKTSVYGFEYLSVDDVVSIYNKNENLFNYTYEWYKGDELISRVERFTLDGNGTVDDNGTYKLVVTANVKKEFLTTALVSSEGATNSFEVTFEMEFIKNKLNEITFVGDSEFDYDGQDKLNNWYFRVEYAIYDTELGQYGENPNYLLEYYAGARNLNIQITRNGVLTTSMKDAGTYIITVSGSDVVYSNSAEFGTLTFEVVVKPYEVELSEYEIKYSKNFNGEEPELIRDIYLANETVRFSFVRGFGEDVGTYDLTVASLTEALKDNYTVKMNGVVLFENGKLTQLGKTTSVGTFEILTSGTLRLSYKVSDANPETIEVGYSADGYRVELDDLTLKIYNGSLPIKILTLNLFDETADAQISNSEVLSLLLDSFKNVELKLFDTASHETVTASGTYTYVFEGLEEISKYYSNLTFAQGYQFVVGKILIDASELALDKVYDGKATEYFDVSGTKIEDIDSFDGVYILATYASAHAGQTRVDLSLLDTNSSDAISNYQLSESSAQATISKLSARLTATMSKDVYEYGEISISNLDSNVNKNYTISDLNGNDVSDILANGYYNIQYSLPTTALANANGYVYKGSYQLQATASFDDFNMNLYLPTVVIAEKRINKGISVGQFSILASENIEATYKETYTFSETGDTFDILYSVVGATVGSPAVVGHYSLALAETEYVNGSIVLSIEAENNGFEVKTEENLVYITLDKDLLSGVYNGLAYSLTVDASAKTLSVANNGVTETANLQFTYASDGSEVEDVAFNSLEIFSGTNTTSFVDAGSFRLSLRANSSTHSNFAFAEEYNFVISKKEIDASSLALEWQYTGSATFTINEFDGKVGEDGVSLVARFASANVGEDIDVTMFLQGVKSVNYELKNTDGLKGKITKADAYIALTKTDFVYGNLTSRDVVPFTVTAGGFAISASQYNIVLNVVDATYSTARYLNCDTYLVSLDESSSSANYNLIFASGQSITVSPFEISVLLQTSGQFIYVYGASETTTDEFVGDFSTPLNEVIRLNFTREDGVEVGYYKVLSANSLSANYQVASVTDRSEGAFRIAKAQEMIYILMSNSPEVLGTDDESATIVYDGNLYDKVTVAQKAGSKKYQLVFESTARTSAKQYYDLNYYSYNAEEDKYTLLSDVTVDGLKANITFANGTGGRNFGNYVINATDETADNLQVSLGKYGQHSFNLSITKREVYFINSTITKVFDNDDSDIVYDEPTQMLSGILADDVQGLTLSISLTQDGKRAKYVGYSYDVEATLIGGQTNYNLNLCTSDGDALVGEIIPALLTVSVKDQTFVYGESVDIDFEYSSDVNLNRYEKGVDVKVMPFAEEEQYSTSGSLKVGDYSMVCTVGTPDFRPVFVVNGKEANNLNDATVSIIAKTLTLEGVKEEIEDIFTKKYDGTKDVALLDEEGEERILLVGTVDKDKVVSDGLGGTTTIHAYDDVKIESATYATEFIGQAITINFRLGGADAGNYALSSWEYGVIEAVTVKLNFNYNANGSNVKSNVENSNLPQLSALAFPFMSDSYLTANSANANTTSLRNFPTNLTGRTGFVFEKWTLSFKNVAEGSMQHTFLTSVLKKLGKTLGQDYSYENQEFKIDVGNNADTVELLKALLNNETDLFGTYYKNDDIEFTFDANWDINKYQVSIKVADETGADADFGKVLLVAGNGEEIEITSSASFTGRFDYGTKLTLKAIANEHCTYYGFYNATGSIHYDNGTASGVSVSTSADGALLTVANLSTTYNFVARFEAEKVNVIFDLSDASDATISSTKFVKGSDNKYSWRATYLELQQFSLANIGLHRDGFELVSISNGTTVASDFENTKLSALVSQGQTELTLTANFEAVGVVVTLDFADGKTENKKITVPFKQNYAESSDWIETPLRTGYNFVGWFDASGNKINGQSVLSTTQNHTLTARWQIASFDISITVENVSISSSANFVKNGNVYTLNGVDFETEIEFNVTADAGYTLENVESWNKNFKVTVSSGVAIVSFKMPAENLVCKISATAKTNTVSVLGDNIGQILAYDITDGTEQALSVESNAVRLQTGKALKLVVSASYGFQMLEEVICEDADVVVKTSVVSDVLTIEISNVLRDVSIELSTLEVINDIVVKFSENDKVEALVVDGNTYRDFDKLPTMRRVAGETLEMYLKYKHGYEFAQFETDSQYIIQCALATEGLYAQEGYYKIVVSDIEEDGQILFTSKISQFTLKVETLSYNELKQLVDEPENKAYIQENSLSSIVADFGTKLTLSYQMLSIYSFAGWSRDGENVFSTDEILDYELVDNETIYAIFSSMKFTIRFGTYNNYTLNSEYGEPALERTIYQEIAGFGERYLDADTENDIYSLELYYGASKTISYVVPTGYRYYGIGYYNGNNFVILETAESGERTVQFTISSLELDEDVVNFVLYVIVKAYSFNININTEIDIEGVREPNIDVGGVELQSENGLGVNQYGYIEGTRTRYSSEDFVDGKLVDDRAFTIVGYTGEDVYIKINTKKVGYKFFDVVSNSMLVTVYQIEKGENYAIYTIMGAIGGTEVDIDVLFRPNLNDIKIGFKVSDTDTNAGAINYVVDAQNANKVFASGRDYSSITVSAYTDSTFEVVAYIRVGYYIYEKNVELVCENDIIDRDSIQVEQLSIKLDGFTAKVSFIVKDYLFENEIYILVHPTTYTVKLVEEGNVLAVVKNVEFGSRLELSEINQANIQILTSQDKLAFVDGKLAFLMSRQNYHFDGFFTSENGAGVMYIDSDGTVLQAWNESGYQLNSLTSKYELTENAYFNSQTGEMEITLYLYWSYYKTRIHFEVVPNVSINATAQDMVSGVDYTNSWYYPTSKLYIEVAFNTNIYIKAPKLQGYKFYKFVIKQKDINGNWLEDVVTFSEEVPWSTNELDKIVECDVQVVYFALVDVVVYGGEGGFKVEQEASDPQARALNEQNYVDTTKNFNLIAEFNEQDYEFVRWNNVTTGQTCWTKDWEDLRALAKTTLILNLQGRTFRMSFADESGNLYDYTFGQILNVVATSTDGTSRAYRLGNYSAGQFIPALDRIDVKVGDKVTFAVAVDYGFAIIWNRDDIKFSHYENGLSYFDLAIENCPQGDLMRILPEFKNEIISIYVNRRFADADKATNAMDNNFVNAAGYTTFKGRRADLISASADAQSIEIGLVTNQRYAISSITVKNYDLTLTKDELVFTDKGNLILTKDFIEAKGILGTVQIEIEYYRLLWEDYAVSASGFAGSGTDDEPFEISSVDELVLMMRLCNSGATYGNGKQYRSASYILKKDLELSDRFWTPIGTEEFPFNGLFNFNGHRVSGIYNAFTYETVSYGGLFGVLSQNAVILQGKQGAGWYIYLIIGIIGLLLLLIVLFIIISVRRKKRREKLANR